MESYYTVEVNRGVELFSFILYFGWVFVNLKQTRIFWEEGYELRQRFRGTSWQECLEVIFLISDWGGRVQTIVGGVTLGQVVLECINSKLSKPEEASQ